MEQRNGFLGHVAGLRGVAIISVILFHLCAKYFPHGYLGVDVFLVIMGYLMFRARLQRGGNDSGKDCLRYLLKRIRRIMTPMLAVILMTVLLGMGLLSSGDETLSCEIGYAACLVRANIYLKRAFLDYFAPDADFVPLLPFWYLSVVLQIGALYALGNLILQRLPERWLIAVLVLLGTASFLRFYSFPIHEWLKSLGCPVWKMNHDISYYQTLPRVWEVMVGGAAVYLPSFRRYKSAHAVLSFIGLLVVLFCTFSGTIPGTEHISGVPWTLLCVAGTAFVLRYGADRVGFSPLNGRALQWLGNLSFSVYLVHMPIFVFWRIWKLGKIGVPDMCGMLALVVAVGYLFRWAVENRHFTWRLLVPLWVMTALLTQNYEGKWGSFRIPVRISSGLSRTVYRDWWMCREEHLNKTLPEQLSPWASYFRINNLEGQEDILAERRLIGMGNPQIAPSFLLIGDSHAAHLSAGLDQVLRHEKIAGIYPVTRIVPFHHFPESRYCRQNDSPMTPAKEDALLSWLDMHKQITHVIIGQFWETRFRGIDVRTFDTKLREFLRELKKRNITPIVVAPTPVFANGVLHYEKMCEYVPRKVPASYFICTAEEYMRQNKRCLPILQNISEDGLCYLIQPLTTLAPGEPFQSRHESQFLMIDEHHLNCIGSERMIRRLLPGLLNALRKKTPADLPSPDSRQLPPGVEETGS